MVEHGRWVVLHVLDEHTLVDVSRAHLVDSARARIEMENRVPSAKRRRRARARALAATKPRPRPRDGAARAMSDDGGGRAAHAMCRRARRVIPVLRAQVKETVRVRYYLEVVGALNAAAADDLEVARGRARFAAVFVVDAREARAVPRAE